jgi:HAE1 family hydrophobic/amphiphilic exporter-1
MAITVIFGLLSSTALTLVVVPVLYQLLAAGRKGGARGEPPGSAAGGLGAGGHEAQPLGRGAEGDGVAAPTAGA